MRRQEGGRVVQPDPARQRKVSPRRRAVPYTLSSPHTRAARLTMAVLTPPRCLCFKQYAAFPPAKPILCAVCCVQRGRASRHNRLSAALYSRNPPPGGGGGGLLSRARPKLGHGHELISSQSSDLASPHHTLSETAVPCVTQVHPGIKDLGTPRRGVHEASRDHPRQHHHAAGVDHGVAFRSNVHVLGCVVSYVPAPHQAPRWGLVRHWKRSVCDAHSYGFTTEPSSSSHT
eukprot:scaffold8833_cov58-Phaeocystis_antarctica.AAC.1